MFSHMDIRFCGQITYFVGIGDSLSGHKFDKAGVNGNLMCPTGVYLHWVYVEERNQLEHTGSW